MKLTTALLVVFCAAPVVSGVMHAQALSGTWQATVKVNGLDIPFRIEFSGSDSTPQATFFNGDERFLSTSGKFDRGSLEIKWEYFASTLKATLKDGELDGQYSRGRSTPYPFHPRPLNAEGSGLFDPARVPRIDGVWEIHDIASGKGEKAWQLIVRQNGREASAAILRIDGDTGTLTGSFRGI